MTQLPYRSATYSSRPYSYSYNPIDFTKNTGDSRPGIPSIVGLRNLGNTNYFNSAFECLIHVIPERLREYFMASPLEDPEENENEEENESELRSCSHQGYLMDLNRENPIGTGGKLTETFCELFRMMWSGKHSVVSPRGFKTVLGQVRPTFAGFAAQDPDEVLMVILDSLHEDLNRVRVKPVTERADAIERGDVEIGRQALEIWKLRNDSVIDDTFVSQIRTEMFCPLCHRTVFYFDPMMRIELDLRRLPANAKASVPLEDLFRSWTEARTLTRENMWYCSTCKEHVEAVQERQIWRLPEILIIRMKRFVRSPFAPQREIDETPVCFPEILETKDLSITNFPLRFEKYQLFAALTHYGGLGGGHDIAEARGPTLHSESEDDWAWYHYDDSYCSETSLEKVLNTPRVYLLFYKAIVVFDEFLNERLLLAFQKKLQKVKIIFSCDAVDMAMITVCDWLI